MLSNTTWAMIVHDVVQRCMHAANSFRSQFTWYLYICSEIRGLCWSYWSHVIYLQVLYWGCSCVTCAVLLQTKNNIVKHVMYCYVHSGWVYMGIYSYMAGSRPLSPPIIMITRSLAHYAGHNIFWWLHLLWDWICARFDANMRGCVWVESKMCYATASSPTLAWSTTHRILRSVLFPAGPIACHMA